MKYLFYHIPQCGGRSLTAHVRENKKQFMNCTCLMCLMNTLSTFNAIDEKSNKVSSVKKYTDVLDYIFKKYDFIEIHSIPQLSNISKMNHIEILSYFIKNNFKDFRKITTIRNPVTYVLKTAIRNPNKTFNFLNVFNMGNDYHMPQVLNTLYDYREFFSFIEEMENMEILLNRLELEYDKIEHISNNNDNINVNTYDRKELIKRIKGFDNILKLEELYYKLLK